jgi:hypothetical protein
MKCGLFEVNPGELLFGRKIEVVHECKKVTCFTTHKCLSSVRISYFIMLAHTYFICFAYHGSKGEDLKPMKKGIISVRNNDNLEH